MIKIIRIKKNNNDVNNEENPVKNTPPNRQQGKQQMWYIALCMSVYLTKYIYS